MTDLEGLLSPLAETDDVVAGLIAKEQRRQQMTLSLIASENTLPLSVVEAVGSVFNAKTAEGYPGHRFHTGCQVADELEQLARERCRALFGAEHANVQPHSGVSANLAVYGAVLRPGDPVLAMKLSHGGHLSHGDAASLTGQVYRFVHYGVDPHSELLDYDQIRQLARAHRPRLLIAGASSYPRLIDYQALRAIADEISAYLLVDMAHVAGLVAAGAIPSPVPYADFVTFTTYKTMMGPHGGVILCRAAFARQVDRAVFPGTQGTPSLALVAGKAVCFKRAATPAFAATQQATLANAHTLCNALASRGYRPVSGGTDTHLVLIDLRPKGLKGNACEAALEEVGILANRNLIPFDPESTQVTSGLRFGTASISVRGMGRAQVEQIADLIDRVLTSRQQGTRDEARRAVAELCRAFPIFHPAPPTPADAPWGE